MTYVVTLAKDVAKQLKKIPQVEQHRIAQQLIILAEQPRPQQCKKLKGEKDLYRLRSGNYRIIYQIKDAELTVLVIKIGHRSSVYD